MKRFFGKIGYGENVKVSPGVYEDAIVTREYYGDVSTNTVYIRTADTILGNASFQTTISVLADAYALENYSNIRFVEWAGSFWTITSVKTERPRLVLMIGEVYNGPTS